MAKEWTQIDKETLRDLLEGYFYHSALECGGVDNWEWYSDSIHEFLEDIDWNVYDNPQFDEGPYMSDLIEAELNTYC